MKNQKVIAELFKKACKDWNLSDGTISLIFKDFILELENQGYKIVVDKAYFNRTGF